MYLHVVNVADLHPAAATPLFLCAPLQSIVGYTFSVPINIKNFKTWAAHINPHITPAFIFALVRMRDNYTDVSKHSQMENKENNTKLLLESV